VTRKSAGVGADSPHLKGKTSSGDNSLPTTALGLRVTTDIYSHALRGRDQDAARRWDEFMRRNGDSMTENSKRM
jgi:hypothetical protein